MNHTPGPDAFDISIERFTTLGNPYTTHPGRMTLAKYCVASKEEGLVQFSKMVWLEMQDPTSMISQELHRIARFARKHNINLVCYCAPNPCHGDIIKRQIEQINRKSKS